MLLLVDSSEMTVQLAMIDGVARYDYEWEAGRQFAHDFLGYLRDRLDEHGWTLSDILGIGVFRGPGSYTGLRIGMSVLNTLADSLSIPIVGATGEGWAGDCERRLQAGENDQIVLPEYGGDAHVTKPRK